MSGPLRIEYLRAKMLIRRDRKEKKQRGQTATFNKGVNDRRDRSVKAAEN